MADRRISGRKLRNIDRKVVDIIICMPIFLYLNPSTLLWLWNAAKSQWQWWETFDKMKVETCSGNYTNIHLQPPMVIVLPRNPNDAAIEDNREQNVLHYTNKCRISTARNWQANRIFDLGGRAQQPSRKNYSLPQLMMKFFRKNCSAGSLFILHRFCWHWRKKFKFHISITNLAHCTASIKVGTHARLKCQIHFTKKEQK